VVAVLSVSWPSFRYGRTEESGWIETVKAAAARISAVLGYNQET
jgi:DNA-binding IclR family transcriptional regulator